MPKGHSIIASKNAQVVRMGTGYAKTPMLYVKGTYTNTGPSATGPTGTYMSSELKEFNKQLSNVTPTDEDYYKDWSANDLNAIKGWTGPTGGTDFNSAIEGSSTFLTLTYRQTLETTFCST